MFNFDLRLAGNAYTSNDFFTKPIEKDFMKKKAKKLNSIEGFIKKHVATICTVF